MRISDWSSDVCSSDLFIEAGVFGNVGAVDLVLGNIGFLAFGVQPFLQVQAQFLGAVAGQGRNAVYRAGPAQGCAQLLLDLFGVRNHVQLVQYEPAWFFVTIGIVQAQFLGDRQSTRLNSST